MEGREIYLLSPTPVAGVRHLPMIEFHPIPQTIDFTLYDGLIFTSKQGVVTLDEISGGEWRGLPAAAIGKQTAAEVEARGGRVIYVATRAYGDVLARELSECFSHYRWLYPRPKVVVSKIAADLRSAGIDVEEKIIYETRCRRYPAKRRPPEGAVLIFTSPSIVRCFFEQFGWRGSYRAVAIGTKTAAAFPEGVRCDIAPSPSMEEAIAFARDLSAP